VGVVQRLQSGPSGAIAVLRRNGTLVEVPRPDIVRLKIVPASRGPVRVPKSWDVGEQPGDGPP
jgi:hypothetical protein